MAAAGRPGDERVTACALEARDGDRAALAEFIRLTSDDVWRFVAHLAGRDQADDLTQDTYLRAMDALPRFAGRAPARTWLLTIARRTVADAVRREMARPNTPRDHRSLEHPRLVAADRAGEVDVELLLGALGPERREAFVLTQVMGFSYAQAAAVGGVAVGTIRSRVARARAELVQACSEDEDFRAAV